MYSEESSLNGPQETISYNHEAVIVSREDLYEIKTKNSNERHSKARKLP